MHLLWFDRHSANNYSRSITKNWRFMSSYLVLLSLDIDFNNACVMCRPCATWQLFRSQKEWVEIKWCWRDNELECLIREVVSKLLNRTPQKQFSWCKRTRRLSFVAKRFLWHKLPQQTRPGTFRWLCGGRLIAVFECLTTGSKVWQDFNLMKQDKIKWP